MHSLTDFIKSYIIIFFMAFAIVTLAACSDDNKPNKTQLMTSLSEAMPSGLEVDSFSVETSEDVGTKVEPMHRTRFNADVTYSEPRYASEGKVFGNAQLLKEVVKKGDEIKIFGVSSSVLVAQDWLSDFRIDNQDELLVGRTLDNIRGDYIIIGSPEHDEYLKKTASLNEELVDNNRLEEMAKNYYDNVEYKDEFFIAEILNVDMQVQSFAEVTARIRYKYESVNGIQKGDDTRVFHYNKSDGDWSVVRMTRR